MSEENNVIEVNFDSEEQEPTALQHLLMETPAENLSVIIAGVLEFLTVRALQDGPFYVETDDKLAITVLATQEDAEALRAVLPKNFKSWEELDLSSDEDEDFTTNSDPGDEQDEPATESE